MRPFRVLKEMDDGQDKTVQSLGMHPTLAHQVLCMLAEHPATSNKSLALDQNNENTYKVLKAPDFRDSGRSTVKAANGRADTDPDA